jgi:hypothetical protein
MTIHQIAQRLSGRGVLAKRLIFKHQLPISSSPDNAKHAQRVFVSVDHRFPLGKLLAAILPQPAKADRIIGWASTVGLFVLFCLPAVQA